MSGRSKRCLGHAAILAIAAWFWASAALAHAVLLGTSPADGTALAQSPPRIVFAFNETVVPADVRIVDANGTLHAGPTGAEVKDGTVTLTLASPLPPGQYVAAYRVASADTHPIAGAIRFSVGETAPDISATVENVDNAERWTALSVIVRFVRDAGLCVGIGGAFFVLLVAPASTALAPIRLALAAAALASLAGAIVAGARLTAPTSLLSLSFWQTTLSLSAAAAAAAILLGILTSWMGLRKASKPLAVVGLVLAALGTALTGHAATGGLDARLAQTAHSLAAFAWLGALIPLLYLAQTGPASAAEIAARRFSALALALVPVALAGSIVLVVARVPLELAGSAYGVLALAKTVLLGGLLAIAAQNRWRLVPKLAADAAARTHFVRNMRIDIVLAAALLAVTAQLSHTPPPSHGALHAHGPAAGISVALMREGHQLTLAIDGPNFDLYLARPDLAAFDPLETVLEISQPALGIEALKLPLQRLEPGHYRANASGIAARGRWQLRIEALVTDFKKIVFETEIELGSASR
ncbi:MAG: copper resistance protein CopC [Telmatospirillum sp.]|nr:copper resistance protein CopC [Telmatospirillum sp.]